MYRIEFEVFTYTYRSYMACEDGGEDDCVGRGYRFNVYRGKRKLKQHHSHEAAEAHIRRLKKQNRSKK